MAHPLDGARLKVVRAQEHLESFKDEIGQYLDSRPYQVPIEIKSMVLTSTAAVVTAEPPLHLSCVLGDCVSNLRASLDYIAWELGTKYAPRPRTKSEQRNITFPIVGKAGTFSVDKRATHLSNTCGVDAAAMKVIESIQPYNAGYEVLDILSVLANTDKHRLPLLTFAHITATEIFMVVNGKWTQLGRFSGGCFSTVHGALGIKPPFQPAEEVKVEGQATVLVAIKNVPMPVSPADLLLGEMVKCVSDIIPRFERFF